MVAIFNKDGIHCPRIMVCVDPRKIWTVSLSTCAVIRGDYSFTIEKGLNHCREHEKRDVERLLVINFIH